MSDPRPYDLTDPSEIQRLHRELEGYMRVSLKDGTDSEGRAYAFAALVEINHRNPRRAQHPEALSAEASIQIHM